MRPTCTWATPLKPSAGSARSTATPCGSRMPALGRISTRALTPASAPSRGASRPDRGAARALDPVSERLAGDALVRLDVARLRARDDVVGNRRGGRELVPSAATRPVAHVLLVKARLPMPGLEALGRPVAGGVRGEHLVGDHQLAVEADAELELRVGEDHAALA